MGRRRGIHILVAAVAAAGALASSTPEETTGTTQDQPLAEDVCPEVYPDLDPSDPVETLYLPEPPPERDLCAAWITAEWDGTGPTAELRVVTFGLRTLGDVALRPDRSYGFSWDVPTDYENTPPLVPDRGYCGSTVWVTDGTVVPSVSHRGCGVPMAWYWPGQQVQADVRIDGPVLEVRLHAALVPESLRASLVNGATLWSFAAVSYLAEPWNDDVVFGGDVTFDPPEPPEAG